MPRQLKIIKANTYVTINTVGFNYTSDEWIHGGSGKYYTPITYPDQDDERGYGNITFAISGNTLPTGLTFITSNGAITGNATSVSDEKVYTITANDSLGSTSTANIYLIVTDVNPTYAMGFAADTHNGGVTQGIKLPISSTLDLVGDFTIEFFIKANSYGSSVTTNLGPRGEIGFYAYYEFTPQYTANTPVIFDANNGIDNTGTTLYLTPRGTNSGVVVFKALANNSSDGVITTYYDADLVGSAVGQDVIYDLYTRSYNDDNFTEEYYFSLTDEYSIRDKYPDSLVEPIWRHVAFVRSGSNLYLYIDGVLISSDPFGAFTPGVPSLSGGQIGRSYDDTDSRFNGFLSNFRVTKSAVYTAGFVPPSVPLQPVANTVLLLNGPTITDNSNNHLTLTAFNSFPTITSTHILPKRPKNNGVLFSANSTFLTLPNSTQLDFGSGDFTIEFYVRNVYNINQTSNAMIVDAGTSSNLTGIGVGTANTGYLNTITFRAQAGFPVLRAYDATLGQMYIPRTLADINEKSFLGTTVRVYDIFQHVACVKSGANGYLFINGVLVDSTTSWGGVTSASIKSGYLGRNRSAASNQYFNGVISNFRVTKSALYTSNFEINHSNVYLEPLDPTYNPIPFDDFRKGLSAKPYIPIANTVLLLNGNSITNLDNSNNRFTFSTVGTNPSLQSKNVFGSGGYNPDVTDQGVASSTWNNMYYPFTDILPTVV